MGNFKFEGKIEYEFSLDETSELVKLFGSTKEGIPSPQLIIHTDSTDRDLLPYDELYDKMKLYENKLRNIKGYCGNAYSLNNLISLIETEIKI